MWKALKNKVLGILEDSGYFAKRSSVFIFGKAGGQVLGSAMGALLGMTALFEGGAAFIPMMIATTVTVAAIAGISGGLVQLDYKHRRRILKERYKEEVGAVLNKAPEEVREEDLEKVARGSFRENISPNPTLHEEFKNEKLKRNIGVILSAVVATATYFIVHAMMHALEIHVDPKELFAGGQQALQTAGGMLASGLTGFLTYNTIKTPLHWLAGEVTGLELETVNDRVTEIKRHLAHEHQVSQDQILEVFVNAHPEVAEQIKAEYGKVYESLPKRQREGILQEVQKTIDIAAITAAINTGRMKPEELAFSAYGQQSGRKLLPSGTVKQHSTNIVDGMWESLKSLTGVFHHKARHATAEELQQHVPAQPGTNEYVVYSPDAHTSSMAYQNVQEEPGRKRSFAALVGRKASEDGISHVERVEQQSSEVLVR